MRYSQRITKKEVVSKAIGRELYTGPRISIKCQTQPKQNGRGYELKNPWEFFGVTVKEIGYDDQKRITQLNIVDRDGRTIFSYGFQPRKAAPKKEPLDTGDREASDLERRVFQEACQKYNLEPLNVLAHVGWKSGKMKVSEYKKAMDYIDSVALDG